MRSKYPTLEYSGASSTRIRVVFHDAVSPVMGYLFVHTGMLRATGTRPSSTHLWYFGTLILSVMPPATG
jgi:hypothetical protein